MACLCSSPQPNPNTTQNITTTTQLPAWYQTYLTNLMSQAQNVAATPYQAYPGQQVADQNSSQTSALQSVNGLQGAFNPAFAGAGAAIDSAVTGNTNAANAGNIAAAQDAGLGQFGAADSIYGRTANSNIGGQFSPYAGAATSFTQQAGQQADPLIQAATAPTGLAAASPYLQAAGQPVSSSIGQYMSPYTSGVVNAIADQSARNLNENLMPALSDDFVKAGQYGSTRQQQLAQNLVRDTNQDTLNQQAQALEAGYNNAGSLAEQDAARQAQLAGTAGGLGSQQQSTMLQAGQSLGNLGLGQASSLSGIGSAQAGASAQGGALQNSAAAGLSNIGQAQQQQALGVANLTSNNTLADYARQLQGGVASGNLASQDMTTQLAGLNAQNALGTQAQQQQQTSLDTAYQDFLNQRNYPQQMTDFLSSIVHGLPVNTSSYQSATGPASASQLQPSAAGQAAGVGVGIAGLSKLFSKGGAVKPAKKRAPMGLGSYKRAA